jgi:predicted O-methyltransferase YrrM
MHRRNISLLKNKFSDKKLTGVEIGVFKGNHALMMLENLNIKKLYLVDPYKYKGLFGKEINFMDAYNEAKEKLHHHSDKIEFILDTSEMAIKKINEKVDFIYIDGNHRFNYVLKDILMYNKILKKDGLLQGHDFTFKRDIDCPLAIILGSIILNKKLRHNDFDSEWWYENKK